MGKAMGSNARAYPMGGMARYRNVPMTEPVPRHRVGLVADSVALLENRSIHQSYVFDAEDRERVLIDGINNAKIGNRVTKGPWRGMRIFTLALEERATCPASCSLLRECYGNGMPVAVRFRHTPSLMARLDEELAVLDDKYQNGFVVRLHVLGDFPTALYVRHWEVWSDEFPALHVWGYTAHPRDSEIGRLIAGMNDHRPDRWSIRFSVPTDVRWSPMQAATIWTPEEMHTPLDALVCPQELGKTQTCGTCALCWSPAMKDTRILFLGHGGRGHKK
jgi:hypothetical protein